MTKKDSNVNYINPCISHHYTNIVIYYKFQVLFKGTGHSVTVGNSLQQTQLNTWLPTFSPRTNRSSLQINVQYLECWMMTKFQIYDNPKY
jgi:hypothetical protein